MPRFGLDVATTGAWSDPSTLVQLARDAETAGWDGFFLWDVLLDDQDGADVANPAVTLGAIAGATERISIGAMVTPMPRRRPWDVAREIATLDRLSRGRVVFGAGLGWMHREFEAFGDDADLRGRAQRLDEGLELVDAFWRGERVTRHGPAYTVDDVLLGATPVQRPRPPVWIAAGWPRARPIERAARWDGVYLMSNDQSTHEPITADAVAAAVARLRSIRGDMDGFEVAVNVYTGELVPAAAAAHIGPFIEAGATWIIELTPDTLEEHRATIHRGPMRPADR